MKKCILNVSLILTTILFLICSCSKDQFSDTMTVDNSQSKQKESRAVFNSSKSMIDEYVQLSKYSQDDLDNWIRTKGFKSALSVEKTSDNTLLSRPHYLRAILNENLEFQIQDTVIWYNKGKLYILSSNKDDDYQTLLSRKSNPTQLAVLGSSEVDLIEVESENTEKSKTKTIPVNDGYTGGLKTFQFKCTANPNVTFRYYHELAAHHFSVAGTYISELNYMANLQYLQGSWLTASYPRNLNFRFFGSVSYPAKGKSFSFNDHPVALKNVTGNTTINLATVNPASSLRQSWQVSLSGSAAHTMVNYPDTQWWYDFGY